jgi:hypothetical protein
MNAPGEFTTPPSQFWRLEANQILLCDQYKNFDPLHISIPLPHVTVGYDCMLIHMKNQDITLWELSLSLISNILMLEIAKWPIWLNGKIFLEFDGHDHLLRQPQPPVTQLDTYPSSGPTFHMTLGCDRGPNS